MAKLSVNINKVATLRNARGGNIPNVVKVALDCERFGAQGITVHPRPDQRHIRYQDVINLSPVLTTEFNIEGYPTEDFIQLVKSIKPAQVTLVPDPPEVLTSNAGWDTIQHQHFLTDVIQEFKKAGVRTSVFIDTTLKYFEYAAKCGTDRIELYTEAYASHYSIDREKAIAPYIAAATEAEKNGLGVNAGHDLSLDNLQFFNDQIPQLLEVSIGHALIADALYYGLQNTVQMYLKQLRQFES
jgi:pyridoxine 5-phosphate synthase